MIKMKKDIKKIFFGNKGVTLIELILSIGILGIILVSFLGIFSSGFRFVVFAGDKSESTFMSQENIDSIISGETVDGSNITTTTMSIDLPDGSTIDIDGKIVTINESKNNQNSVITTFISD